MILDEMMFRLSQPAAAEIATTIAATQNLPPATPHLLTLTRGIVPNPQPRGFVHDFSQSEIGCGADVFECARQAFSSWAHFNLGWVRVANPAATIALDTIVAVEVHAAGLWSLNLSRIVETTNTATQFGFLYATTRMHAEEGQERFLLLLDPTSQSVTYLIEAVSRPRHPLARLAYPFTRAMQHRFVRDSHLRLRRTANSHSRLEGTSAS